MILFTLRGRADLPALFARCVAGRPRGPAPPVVIQITAGVRTLAATTPEGVTLTHASPAVKEGDDLLVLPAATLAEVEGGTDEAVALDRPSKLRGVLRWPDGGKPRSLPVELLLPGKQHEIPAPPPFTTAPAALLAALHECGRTAARESGRYALSKVQVQGKAGRVVGTDGKVALLWTGFTFSFSDDLLVPAVPVFGSKPLARITEVKFGRTATHLVVAAGPWAVWLPTDTRAKFPDVAGVVPRYAPTTVSIDPSDAAALLPVLPGLPGGDHELRPVTLDVDGVVRVRGRAESGERVGETREVPLPCSTVSGPAVRVALDRRVLARALALGCHTLKLTPAKPVVAEGADLTLVAAPLDPALVAPPPADEPETPSLPTPERRTPMKPESNGHTPPRGDPGDPLDLAEELRRPGRRRHEGRPAGGRAAALEEGEEGAVGRADQPEAVEPRRRRSAMSALVTQRCHRLAGSLAELKVKVRAALATELAGAVGLAVRDVLVAALIDRVLAVPTRPVVRPPTPSGPGGWRDEEDEDCDRWGNPKDPWADPDEYEARDRTAARYAPAEYDEFEPPPAVPVAAAVAVGVNIGRWWLARQGTVAAAVGFGVLAAALGLAGGPLARAALAVLAAATDVLTAESALARLDPA